MPGERLVEAMIRAGRTANPESERVDIVFGTVKTASPLTIQIDEKQTLPSAFFVLSPLVCKQTIGIKAHRHEYKDSDEGVASDRQTEPALETIQLWGDLKAGERVRMMRVASGQLYYVLDRGETL